MTFLPKLEDNYRSLRVALDTAEPCSPQEKKWVSRAVANWNWTDPERKNYLPQLMMMVDDDVVQEDPDVLVVWVDDVDDILEANEKDVVLKDSAFGCCVTDTSTGEVTVYIDRNMHKQLGVGWEVRVIEHELGHAGGLRHADAAKPSGIMQPSVVGTAWLTGSAANAGSGFRTVTQLEREALRDLRVDGVVGVDSYEGN